MARKTNRKKKINQIALQKKELRDLQTARVCSASDREVGRNLKFDLLI